MAHATRSAWFATWYAQGLDSAADRAVSNPASLGAGADLIGFGGGQPAAESYPLEALELAFSRAIVQDGRHVLPYGPSQGLPALRELVAERLSRRGIDTEAPTFMGALTAWEQQQPSYLTVPVDEHGMVVDVLEQALAASPVRPKFVYLLPTFQNPSGVSLTPSRRRRLLDLAREHDLLIIEDDPYGEFWFDEGAERVPPLRSLPGAEDHVVYLGTFSKILAPGIRLAYAVVRPDLVSALTRAKRGVDFHTDTLLQQAVVHLVRDGDFDLAAHIAAGRRLYKERRDAMLDALEATF